VRSLEWHDGRAQIKDFRLADQEWLARTEHDKKPIAIQERDDRRAKARRQQRRFDPGLDPIPIDLVDVVVADPDCVLVCTTVDDRDDSIILDAAGAEQLAQRLIEQAAVARRWKDQQHTPPSGDAA
jgi:hypothetical protein